jgi:hypothetical protein
MAVQPAPIPGVYVLLKQINETRPFGLDVSED